MKRPRAASMARLLATPKPRFTSLAISRTGVAAVENSRASISAEPSREALSTTMISAAEPSGSRPHSAMREARHSRSNSRVLKETTMIETAQL